MASWGCGDGYFGTLVSGVCWVVGKEDENWKPRGTPWLLSVRFNARLLAVSFLNDGLFNSPALAEILFVTYVFLDTTCQPLEDG